MSATSALQASLDATNAALVALTTRVTNNEAAIKALADRLGLDEATIAGLLPAIIPPPVITPPVITPPPTVDPLVQWRASMESGQLLKSAGGDWDEEVNSGAADSSVVLASSQGIAAHSGQYVLKQSVASAGGTRMHRYAEVDALTRAGTKYYWSWWDYFPSPISFPAQNTWIIWGLESVRSAAFGSSPDPFYSLVFHPTGNTLDLVFNPSGLTVGLPPKVIYPSNVPVPVGQWNFFEAEILPRGDLTGSLQVWMNRQLLFPLTGVLTMWPNIGQQPLLGVIEQTGYGDVAFTHFIDDVTLSLGRMS